MKEMKESELQQQLKLEIEKAAEKIVRSFEKELRGQQTVVSVSVSLIPLPPPVVVKTTVTYSGRDLVGILQTIPVQEGRTRIWSCLNNGNLLTLDTLRDKSWQELRKLRSFGDLSILRLARALQDNGVECELVKGVVELETRMQLRKDRQAEIEAGTVRALDDNEWQMMSLAVTEYGSGYLSRPRTAVLAELRKRRNAATSSRELFPTNLETGLWRQSIVGMNRCWELKRLPYRLRFVQTVGKQSHVGEMQIVTVK